MVMPRVILSIDGVVIKEVQLTKDRTTLGRRPYNDIVIDNLAVSGEHAVIEMSAGVVNLEDLNSTNGTYVNGRTIKKQLLKNDDSIEIGKYQIKFLADAVDDGFQKTMIFKAGTGNLSPPASTASSGVAQRPLSAAPVPSASIKVLSGAAAGREVSLTKVVTTIGKPGVAVAAVTRRQHGFFVHHVEGEHNPLLNGTNVGKDPLALKDGDVIELAGTRMQFLQA
jgi:pSer/pThr/pTyr-binding forkhead associated (FHA) protein